jgi:hypothetical protein
MVSFSEGGTGIGVLAPAYMNKAKKKKACKPCKSTGPKLSGGATGVGVLAPKKQKVRFPKGLKAWMAALKRWNSSHSKGSWCIPKKGSSDYEAVRKMM